MKTKYIYKGEEILHSTFISLCRKIGVNGGRNLLLWRNCSKKQTKETKKRLNYYQICKYNE